MAKTIQVDGLADISVAGPPISSGALMELGYSMDGVQITERAFTLPVHTDEFGGDAGPPADVQFMGMQHIIRMVLTKWNETTVALMRRLIATSGSVAGTSPTPGTLWFQDSGYWRLLINTTNRPRNYLKCTFEEPMEINKGTKHSQLILVATAYAQSGTLYNTTTTGTSFSPS